MFSGTIFLFALFLAYLGRQLSGEIRRIFYRHPENSLEQPGHDRLTIDTLVLMTYTGGEHSPARRASGARKG